MRITGNGKEIDILYIEHKGLNETFVHHSLSGPISVADMRLQEECLIEFSDIREIDDLIEMLNEVKNDCKAQIGHWNLSKRRWEFMGD